MSNGPFQKEPQLLLWYWVLGLVGCAVAALVHIFVGAAIVCLAGALRKMAGYDFPSFEELLEAIPGWKYFVGTYLLCFAAISLRYMAELSEWPVGPFAVLMMWPLIVPAVAHDLWTYKDEI